jgi:WD40 repeat protein
MTRVLLAACALLAGSPSLRAVEPRPLWEQTATSAGPASEPVWMSYSPDGRAIVVVTARALPVRGEGSEYHLRVYDSHTRKERFNASLGTSKSFHWSDDLASFPSDDTVMTGGQAIVVRNLENGSQTSSQPTGGLSDHAVWAVPDLKESFFLRRDPQRFDLPVEFFYHGRTVNQFDEWGGRGGLGFRSGSNMGMTQTTLTPPRGGLRTEVVAMNAGRTRLAAAFRDVTPAGRPRHLLTLYHIKTMENLELELTGEATNPHPGPVTAVTFARNGRMLASGGEDGSIAIWDVSDHLLVKPRATVTGLASHRVYALAFSNDWRYLAAVTWDKAKPNLLLIDVDTARSVRSLRLERQLNCVVWHPEGHTLLTAGASGKIQAWDVAALLKGN